MTEYSPTYWPRKRLKYAVQLRRSRAEGNYEHRPYIGLEHIESGTGRLVDTTMAGSDNGQSSSASGESLCSSFEAGDVLFGKLRPYLAKAWIASFSGRCTTELLVMHPGDFDRRFLRYVLLSRNFVDVVDASTFGSKMPRADWDFIGNVPIPLPSIPHQRVVADYLDNETSRLDALAEAKERLLELLAEKRQALITRAVTRGLDPHTAVRESGLSWAGPIPTHWGTWKIRHLAQVGNGSTPSRENEDYWREGSVPWLNSSVVNQAQVSSADEFVTERALKECHLPLVQSGSVLVGITGQGKTRAQATVLSFAATINQHLAFVTPQPDLAEPWYLRWLLYAAYEFLRSISDDTGGTKGALTCEELGSLRLPLPPLQEQGAIVKYITDETTKLDTMRAAAERTIVLLKERRAGLIVAGVTGQLKIPEAA